MICQYQEKGLQFIIMHVRFFPNFLCNIYVTLCMRLWFRSGGFGMSFCGLYCPNIIVFLACRGTWHCEHTLFCVEVVKHYL